MLNRLLTWLFGGDAAPESMQSWKRAQADMRRLVWRRHLRAWVPAA